MRGLASLGVVLWHWRHFYLLEWASFQVEQLPLSAVFDPFYTAGWRAVNLFFILSGFVFFCRYGRIVEEKRISAWDFSVLRFARLYPLHLLTLCVVAVAQYFWIKETGAYFVYQHNDVKHFLLHLVFASNWGSGSSFNAPVWSVAFEVLLYAFFFVVCVMGGRRWWFLGLLTMGSFLFTLTKWPVLPQLGECALAFFIGGLVYTLYTRILASGRVPWASIGLVALTLLLWFVVPSLIVKNVVLANSAFKETWWTAEGQYVWADLPGFLLFHLSRHAYELLLFPPILLSLALLETWRGSLGRRLAWLGQISYSSYLWHFPLQIAFAAIALGCALPVTFFNTPLALGLFFGLLIPVALLSYHYFEVPCQRWIKARALSRRH